LGEFAMSLFLAILGTAITVISFFYALYTGNRLTKLKNYNREQAWEIYRQASNVLGLYQLIDDLHIDNSNLIKLNAQGERAALELVVNSVRMVKRFENKYSEEQIKRWFEQGKLINESHVKTFRNFL
jgi:hypothetical protein